MAEVVLGVDPGFSVTGFGILAVQQGATVVEDCGFLRMHAKDHLSVRVGQFYDFFSQKISSHAVGHIALETSFLGQNAQTFLKLGYLRGILYLLAHQHGLALSEFAPREVKIAVTGTGAASKEQVAFMVQRIVPGITAIAPSLRHDVTDAVAVALCGIAHMRQMALRATLIAHQRVLG